MRLTQLFTKTLREAPGGEVAKNSQLLTRGGFIFKNMAGVYSMLPLGVRVLDKIRRIIREEMNAIGGQELYLNTLQDKSLWDKTGRWNIEDVMYEWQDGKGHNHGLGFTHEEVIGQIGSVYIESYKDLPKYVYQIQTKFRREERPQAGLLRCREFEMKDLYSLNVDEKDLKDFYEQCAHAYSKIFERMGLQAIRTKAHGGVFNAEGSDEFQVVAEVGEDTIYFCKACKKATNKEVIEKYNHGCGHCGSDALEEKRAIEVGNIFQLGTKFSEPLGLMFVDEKGNERPVWMGSYGIGTGRAMATVVEVHHDDNGIIWPPSIAPFTVYLIGINKDARQVYDRLVKAGIAVLYDDRDGVSPGQRFADADLIGCPYRVVISGKTGKQVEIKRRGAATEKLVSLAQAIDIVNNI